MANCTHGPPTPCARCRVEKWVELWAPFENFKDHHRQEVTAELVGALEAHAAAARREAFEDAAQWVEAHNYFSQESSKPASEVWTRPIAKMIHTRAAKEGSDD
jgi:hypothetical protein